MREWIFGLGFHCIGVVEGFAVQWDLNHWSWGCVLEGWDRGGIWGVGEGCLEHRRRYIQFSFLEILYNKRHQYCLSKALEEQTV